MCFCRFYYDSESNVLWCKIRKAGSTTYVSTFARVADKRLAALLQVPNTSIVFNHFN